MGRIVGYPQYRHQRLPTSHLTQLCRGHLYIEGTQDHSTRVAVTGVVEDPQCQWTLPIRWTADTTSTLLCRPDIINPKGLRTMTWSSRSANSIDCAALSCKRGKHEADEQHCAQASAARVHALLWYTERHGAGAWFCVTRFLSSNSATIVLYTVLYFDWRLP